MLHLHEENSIAQLLCNIYNLIKIVLKNKPDSTERKNKGDEFQSSSNETTLVSGKTCGSELEEALPVVQVKVQKPLSVFDDIQCEELAYPHLFPNKESGFKVIRERFPCHQSKKGYSFLVRSLF